MKKKTNKNQNLVEKVFSVVFSILAIVFLVQLFLMDKLPMLYFMIVVVLLGLISAGLVAIQMSKKVNKSNKTLGKVLMGLFSILLIVGNVYIFKTNSAFSSIVDHGKKKIEISVVVMKDSSIEDVKDLKGKLGNVTVGDSLYTDRALDEIEKETQVNVVDYIGFDSFGDALYNGEVEAIVLNESFRNQFEEKHPTFDEDTRVIKTYTYEEENNKDISVNVDVTKEPFNVYISGIDQRGTIDTTGRSDVNKVMTVNPQTRQIFIVDIPRDYYVKQVCQANQLDKLTHTGIFGVDCTVESMSNYLGIDINYYVRINFSSLETIVDALGGITVDSAYDFTAQGYTFTVGPNQLNGAEALAFSRERYSFGGGDGVRIENQTRVLKGIIDKVTSPAILTNYLSFMDAISGTFQTNMSEKEMNALIKMQLNDMRGWTITSDHLSGKGATDWTPANGFNAYVMYPDGTSRERVLKKMETVMQGGTVE